MLATLEKLQLHISSAYPGEAAVGVSLHHLEQQLRNVIDQASSGFTLNLPIRTTKLALSVRADSATPSIHADMSVPTPTGHSHLRIDDLVCEFSIHELDAPAKELSKFSLEFKHVWLAFYYKNSELHFRSVKQTDAEYESLGRNPVLIKDHFPKTADHTSEQRYELFEYTIRFNAAIDSPQVLAETLSVPQITSAFRSLKMLPPLTVTEFQDYLLFRTSAAESPQVPERPCFETVMSSNPGTPIPHHDQDPSKSSLEVRPSYKITNRHHTPVPHDPEMSPVGFFYTPADIEEKIFSPVMPAVAVLDDGGALGIYWEYHAFAALSAYRLERTGFELTLKAVWKIRGHAGAGIKIGCFKWEVLGAAIEGHIGDDLNNKPMVVKVTFEQDDQGRIVTRADTDPGDVSIKVYSSDIFPLDKVAELILGSLTDNVLRDVLREITERLERVIIDPRILFPLPPVQLLHFRRSIDGNSTILGWWMEDLTGAPDGKVF